MRKTISIYFYDVGVRNDVRALFENLVIAEKEKEENFIGNLKNYFFLRTYSGQEIDLIGKKAAKVLAATLSSGLTKENFLDYLTGE